MKNLKLYRKTKIQILNNIIKKTRIKEKVLGIPK